MSCQTHWEPTVRRVRVAWVATGRSFVIPAIVASAWLLGLGGVAPKAQADILVLKGGRKLEVQVMLTKPDKLWVRTLAGAEWIARSEIAEHHVCPSPWERYDEVRKRFAMTAVSQFELAAWCADNHLTEQRTKHLKFAVALDPNYEPACLALGYVRVGDRWEPPQVEGINANEGRPARQVGGLTKPGAGASPNPPGALPGVPPPTEPTPPSTDASPALQLSAKEIAQRKRLLAYQIENVVNSHLTSRQPDVFEAGRRKLLAIKDPLAVDGFIEGLAGRREAPSRLVLVEALGQRPTDRARAQLLLMALTDSSPAVAAGATAQLAGLADPRIHELLRAGLRHGTEDLLERCARILTDLRDFDAIPDLVAVLVERPRHYADVDPNAIARFVRAIKNQFGNPPLVAEPSALMVGEKVKSIMAGLSVSVPRPPDLPPDAMARPVVNEMLTRLADGQVNYGVVQAAWLEWYNRTRADRLAAQARQAQRPN